MNHDFIPYVKHGTCRIIRDHLDNGRVLHGTKALTHLLEPRLARDVDRANTTGNWLGVYASGDVRIPIFRALAEKRDPSHPCFRGYTGNDERMRFFGQNITLTSGYIYVLPNDGMTFINKFEIVSRLSVKPISILRIEIDIISELDDVDILFS